MREMWMLASVLFPMISGTVLWIWNPDQNKMRTITVALSLSGAICSWLVILSYLGMRLPLWNISPGMELCLRLDEIGTLFSGLAPLIWVLVVFFALKYMEYEREEVCFSGCLIMSLGVLTGIAHIGNFVILYLFFGMMTSFNISLMFHFGKREAFRAGVVYPVCFVLGASIALGDYFFSRRYACGAGFKAGGVLVEAVGTAQDRPQIILLSVFCMTTGFFCKAGLIPFHPWPPIAHPVAPTSASIVLSDLIAKVGVMAVIRVVYDVAGPTFLRGTWAQHALLSMAVLTIFTGSTLAYKEKKLKGRLACSSFSQVSYALFGIFLLFMEELYDSLLQIVFRALAKNAPFSYAGVVTCKTGYTRIKETRGMGRRISTVILCFTLTPLSPVGIPLAGGFLVKWHLAVDAMRTEADLLTQLGSMVLMVSALLTAGYLFPVIMEEFFPGEDWEKTEKSEADGSCTDVLAVSVSVKVSLAVLDISLLVLSTLGEPIFELSRGIASAMV